MAIDLEKYKKKPSEGGINLAKYKKSTGPFKYDVPEIKESREDKIARYQQEAAEAEKEADKYKGLGFVKQFGKEFVKNLAPSEVGLGKTIAKTFGNQRDKYTSSIENVSGTQQRLIRQIREKEERGEDTTKLKRLYNEGVDTLSELQKGLDEELDLPTTGQAVGQLGGTALDVLTAGTYGRATTGAKSFQLTKTKELPTAIQMIRNTARSPQGLGTRVGAGRVATGAGIGYGFDVSHGLQGLRGEDREGGKAFIPGAGTAIGTAIPTLSEGAQSLRNRRGPLDSKTTKIINKRQKQLEKVEDNYSTLRKLKERSAKQGFNAAEDIANTDLLVGAVDDTGTIRTTNAISELNDVLDPVEDIVARGLKKEGRRVGLDVVEAELKRKVRNSGLEGDALTRALRNVEREIAGYQLRTDPNGMISLADLHNAKISKTKTINYQNPKIGVGDKAIANGLKELIEQQSKSIDVKQANRELARFYNMRTFLERLDGKKVQGGKLGKYFASTIGGMAGSHFGPIGTIIGAEAGARTQGHLLSRAFGSKVGKTPGSAVLSRMSRSVDEPFVPAGLLPSGPTRMPAKMPRANEASTPSVIPAKKGVPGQNPQTGRFFRTYMSDPNYSSNLGSRQTNQTNTIIPTTNPINKESTTIIPKSQGRVGAELTPEKFIEGWTLQDPDIISNLTPEVLTELSTKMAKYKPKEKMTLYRGVPEGVEGTSDNLTSWTTDRDVAEMFAEEVNGRVIKKTFNPDEILVDTSELPSNLTEKYNLIPDEMEVIVLPVKKKTNLPNKEGGLINSDALLTGAAGGAALMGVTRTAGEAKELIEDMSQPEVYNAKPTLPEKKPIETLETEQLGTNYDPYDPDQTRPNPDGIGAAGVKLDESMVAVPRKKDNLTANIRLGSVIYVPDLNKIFLVADLMNKRFNGKNKIDFVQPGAKKKPVPRLNKNFGGVQILRLGDGRRDAREFVSSGGWDKFQKDFYNKNRP